MRDTFKRTDVCCGKRDNGTLLGAKKKGATKPRKDMEGPYMHSSEWKKPIWKGYNAV